MSHDQLDATGIPPGDPAHSPPVVMTGLPTNDDTLQAIHGMLQNLHQRVSVVETQATVLQNHANQQAQPVQAPAAAPVSPARTGPPRLSLQPYAGKGDENLQAWLNTAEDALRDMSHPRDRWTVAIAPYFREQALVWYQATRVENNHQAPHWDDLKPKLLSHFEPPACLNELRAHLHRITYHGDMDQHRDSDTDVQHGPRRQEISLHKRATG
ncbi:hypothetical protein EDB84DRAFT_1436598 [Lactarius hengduanensis]|nr:hypothetical protein EDB84DRAFT_1444888 [Lactarius hengduanensis]KAH9041444.1 hypothetical protein EDB84DRAFT_1436598 [Lactarius hengduanensis]